MYAGTAALTTTTTATRNSLICFILNIFFLLSVCHSLKWSVIASARVFYEINKSDNFNEFYDEGIYEIVGDRYQAPFF